MHLKFIILSTIFAAISADSLASVRTHFGVAPTVTAKLPNSIVGAVASTHQNVVRSFDGTVSQYSKSIQTPYSSVHKEDTRVNNNIYTPAIAKTVTYAAPVAAKTTTSYTPVPASASADFYTSHAGSVVTKAVYAHQEPNRGVYASLAPHTIYSQKQHVPAFYSSPTHTASDHIHENEVSSRTTYNQRPTSAIPYTRTSPTISAYGSSQTVHYSPAEMVSHVSFDGFGTHWGS